MSCFFINPENYGNFFSPLGAVVIREDKQYLRLSFCNSALPSNWFSASLQDLHRFLFNL